jgi:hypothetical protein
MPLMLRRYFADIADDTFSFITAAVFRLPFFEAIFD